MLSLAVARILADKEAEVFGSKSKEEKLDYMTNNIIKHNKETEEIVKYFNLNWDKEDDEVKASFCEMAKVYKILEAVSILRENIEFRYFSIHVERSRTITEGRVALEALIQIGLLALEPSFEAICTQLDSLAVDENTRFRIAYFEEILKYLPVKMLGKKLAIYFLKDKLDNGSLSDKVKQYIANALVEIEKER